MDLELVWTVMKWPLVACLVLPPLLVYLGLHVVQREVIFVDLALAQVATFGTSIAPGQYNQVGLAMYEFPNMIFAWILFLLRPRREAAGAAASPLLVVDFTGPSLPSVVVSCSCPACRGNGVSGSWRRCSPYSSRTCGQRAPLAS